MKKLTAFLSALLVSLSLLLTACGSSQPAKKKGSPQKHRQSHPTSGEEPALL